MMLLLDVGNTAIKWGVWRDGVITDTGHFRHRDAGDIRVLAEEAWKQLPVPKTMVVANVAGPAVAKDITSWAGTLWNITPQYIEVTSAAAGVCNAYANPRDLGVDRWAAMIAAHHDCRGVVCVVDCGSAITIDVLGPDGMHQGGMIAPGISTMRDSLVESASGIRMPQIDMAQPVTLLARSTAEAVNNGVVYMAGAMIDRVVADVAAQQDGGIEVVMTGGDADRVLPLLGWNPRLDPDLVLKGVAILAGETACDS